MTNQMKPPPQKLSVSSIVPESRRPLTIEDYNFSAERVPDLELVSCLLFELLRESATAQHLTQSLTEKLEERGILGPGFGDGATGLLKQVESLRFCINHPLNMLGFISCAVTPIPAWDFIGLLNNPWQKLRSDVKQLLTQHCTEVNKAAYISDCDSHTDQLANAMAESVIEDSLADRNAPATAKAIASLDIKGSYKGRKIFGVVVDYALYDDNAIRAELDLVKEEIIKNRPKDTQPQMRKESGLGRNAEWRGMLNSLGLARLSAHYTAQELRTKLPTVYDQIAEPLTDKGTTAVQKKLDSARRRFVARFHEILLFEKDPPLCLRPSRTAK